jgi:hypothetical protein
MPHTLPDAACPGLYRKPLDTAIGQLLAIAPAAPRVPPTLLAIPMAMAWVGTLPCALPNGGGPGLH